MFRIIRRALCATAIIAAQCACAAAQDGDGRSPIPHYLETGDYNAARAVLLQRVAGHPEAALFAAHLEALIMLRQGRVKDATDLLRQILGVAPEFEPARRELTVLLARTGQIESALYHAGKLLDQTDSLRIQNELGAFIRAFDSDDRQGVSTRFAILPSSNANRGTDQETILIGGGPFTIDPASRAHGGVGVGAGVTAWKSWRLSEFWTASAHGSLDVEYHESGQVADEQSLSPGISFTRSEARTRLSLEPALEFRAKDWKLERRRAGMNVGTRHALSPRTSLEGRLSVFRQDHKRETFRDGTIVFGSAGLEYRLSEATTLSVGAPFTMERTERAHLDHNDLGANIGVGRRWSGGLHTGLTLGYRDNKYRGAFPGTAISRRDHLKSIGVSLRHQGFRIGNSTPEFSITYTDSSSNAGFYEYVSVDTALGFGIRF